MRVMTEEEIPAFVAEIAATGCDITGLAGIGYVIGDIDLPKSVYRKVLPKLQQVLTRYGERDYLLEEISTILISIGRSYPLPVRH